jgi:hypothetical protein
MEPIWSKSEKEKITKSRRINDDKCYYFRTLKWNESMLISKKASKVTEDLKSAQEMIFHF